MPPPVPLGDAVAVPLTATTPASSATAIGAHADVRLSATSGDRERTTTGGEQARWNEWTARYAESDRRTAATVRVFAGVVLTAAVLWVIVSLV